MLPQRLMAGCLAFALLAGCATGPDDPCDMHPPEPTGGIYIYDVLFLPVYLLVGMSCEGIRALDRHGAFTPPTKGKVEGGVYEAGDGSFSVTVPDGLETREQYAPDQDYVFFAPRFGKGPVYVVSVSPKLDPAYASLSLEEFAAASLKDANFQNQRLAGPPLVELHREDVALDGHTALAVFYNQTPQGAAKPSAYYLMYFMKTRDRAAVLSVAWPGDCPKCSKGPDAEVRAMDPELQKFVEGFRLIPSGSAD